MCLDLSGLASLSGAEGVRRVELENLGAEKEI